MKWLEIAQALPQGHHARIDCGCGKGKTLVVNNNPKYYSAHCFRCDYSPYHDKGIQTLAQLAEIKQLNADAYTDLKVELPHDYTTDIPLLGRLWLYRGGLSETTWKRHRIGFSPSLQRVVLPTYDIHGELQWLQCRAILKGQVPKYIQPSRERGGIMFACSPHNNNDNTAILVEDICSTIRVGKYTQAFALLGTSITTKQCNILSRYSRIYTWFDNDKGGKQGAYKVRRALSLLTTVGDIRTEDDPKTLTDEQIIHTLKQINLEVT